MFAIGWLELGEAEKAQILLEKCFKNIQGPFQVLFWLTQPHNPNKCLFAGNPLMCDYISSQVWSESSDGSGVVNFLTGMGGFLQAVLFGYTGFRLVNGEKHLNMCTACRQWNKGDRLWCFFSRVQKECLAFSPLLPNNISELCIRGVNYLGSQMDWLLRKEEVCIILREKADSAGNTSDLQVVLKASGTKIPLTPGNRSKDSKEAHLGLSLYINNKEHT